MNKIEVMKLPVGSKVKSSVCDGKVLEIREYDGTKFLKFENDFRRIFLDADITDAKFEIVNE